MNAPANLLMFIPEPAGGGDQIPFVEELMIALADEHGGPAGRMSVEHLRTGGKRIRARLALSALTALGGDARLGVPWAASCELIHNASLVHDDVQDGDRMRRDAPALWAVHGMPQAISVGDLMLMLPTTALEHLDASDALRWALSRLIARHGAETARGQSAEIALRDRVWVTAAEYEYAAAGKTAGLFALPVEGSARLAGCSAAEAERLAAPFARLGLLYQMQDDVIDLYGDKGRGEVGADLREGKVSALVAAHMELHPVDRLWLHEILRRSRVDTTAEVVQDVSHRFVEGGALEAVLTRIEEVAASTGLDDLPCGLRAVATHLQRRIERPLHQLLEHRGRLA